MELEPANPEVVIRSFEDRRLKMPEPPPVRLIAVADVTLPAPAGVEQGLDAFYVGLLRFERDLNPYELVYHAENFALRFTIEDRPVERESLRATGIEVESLAGSEQKLIDAGIAYVWQRGVMPGMESLVLLDPAGNWVELTESRAIR
jgi:hypothetical protein